MEAVVYASAVPSLRDRGALSFIKVIVDTSEKA
jgi:hypothetical protein